LKWSILEDTRSGTGFEESDWCVLNVMLVRVSGLGYVDLFERVAVGQIHLDAWDLMQPISQVMGWCEAGMVGGHFVTGGSILGSQYNCASGLD